MTATSTVSTSPASARLRKSKPPPNSQMSLPGSAPETPRLLGRAAEKTLVRHQTRLAELGHTGETLAEKMAEYVGRVRASPEAFLEKMEPGRARERVQKRDRGPERDDGRGFGYSR